MSIPVATLVGDLQADVPARNGVPSADQYHEVVRRAVRDYARRRPMEKLTTLSVVSGQASYTLPDDFLFFIRLESPFVTEEVIHSAEGLIPVPPNYREVFTINGLTLTFFPAPVYTATRYVRYGAGHVLDTEDAYPNLTDFDADIVLLKAKALVLWMQAQAAAIAGEMVEYQIGDERVKRASAADALNVKAGAADEAYEAALQAAIGPTGTRARYAWYEGEVR